MINKKTTIAGTVIGTIVVLMAGLQYWQAQDTQEPPAEPVESITLAINHLTPELSSLILTAETQGFFENNGIKLDFVNLDSGGLAMDALIENQVDMAVAAEYALLSRAIKDSRVTLLASVIEAKTIGLLTHPDRAFKVRHITH